MLAVGGSAQSSGLYVSAVVVQGGGEVWVKSSKG